MKPRKPMTECRNCPHRKHARACRTCGCAYLSKAAKPLPHRNPKRRPAAAASAQREAAVERSGGRCEFERWYESQLAWLRCAAAGKDTAHLVRRWLAGDAIYDPAVVLFACRPCHDEFDHRSHPATWNSVRPPGAMFDLAINAVRRAEAERAERGLAVVPLPNGAAK